MLVRILDEIDYFFDFFLPVRVPVLDFRNNTCEIFRRLVRTYVSRITDRLAAGTLAASVAAIRKSLIRLLTRTMNFI